jgi:type I restriction-modification system DNA methylase subunit
MTKEEAKTDIVELVTKYQAEAAAGKLKAYSEEDVKKGFILPLFAALGWHTKDRDEVSAEEYIKSSGRVDYGFYLDGRAKFYLEAKKPTANIHDEKWARQAIRYSWNKGVTWAVLTNFDRLLVFNAQDVKSSLKEKLLFDIPCADYIGRFEDIERLSKDSLAANALDVYAERIGKKYQKVPITLLLYKDLNECRRLLTQSLAQWNPELKKKQDLLDEGVQKLLDRLIFIRVAEDRGVEPPTLLPLLRAWEADKGENKTPLYQSMIGTFRELDKIYDSNLFSEHPFEKWEEYSNTTKDVVALLYGKEGYYEYDFKVMPADVLGTVYENYLGYRLSQAKSKKKLFGEMELSRDAGKRKEQGIYYTPAFVVDYIVRHALQPVLDRCKTYQELLAVKILDPACGSGSFLLKALEVLNEKYKELGQKGDEDTKRLILTMNLFGVDLDEQAVEIAKLNLLINSLDKREPLAATNIKCGNSLISGTDVELKKYFGADFRGKKPFNWKEEFPDVFKQGGFDVVIGNPPYVRPENVEEDERSYFIKSGHFEKFFGRFDIYILFIERALKLLRENGNLSFIIPSSFFNQNYAKVLREWLLTDFEVEDIEDLSDVKVFDSAAVQCAILLAKNVKPNFEHVIRIGRPQSIENAVLGLKKETSPQTSFLKMPQCMIRTDLNIGFQPIIDKVKEQSIFMSDICYVAIGIVPHDSKTGASKDRLISSKKISPSQKRYIEGKDIGRYKLIWRGIYLDYQPKLMHRPKFKELLENDKLFVRNISTKEGLLAVLDREKYYSNDTVSICVPWYLLEQVKERGVLGSEGQLANSRKYDLLYLLAVINSKLLNFYFKKVLSSNLHVYPEAVRSLPIHRIDFENLQEKEVFADLTELAEKLLDFQKQFHVVEEHSNDWERIKSEIEKTDRKIDEAVYQLYGLTPEEIAVVEGKSQG